MASANVPCGTSVASISPPFTAATASGFDVKYDEMPRLIRPWRSSPEPATRLADVVRDDRQLVGVELSTRASMSVSGAPTAEAADHDRVAGADRGHRLLGLDGAAAIAIRHVPFVAEQREPTALVCKR